MQGYKMNIIIVGDGKVGKTSILKRFDKRQFQQAHIRTIGVDFITAQYKAKDDTEVQVKLWDTAGQDRFRNLTYQFYRQADGIIITFDMTNIESFKNVRTWIMSIYKVKNATLPKILVGNKLDMTEERVVDRATAEKMAEEYGVKYFETSALTGDGIAEMMDNIMAQVYDFKIVPEKEQAEKRGTTVTQTETVQLHRQSVHRKPNEGESAGGGCCGN